MTLPSTLTDGQPAWGDPLNADLAYLDAQAAAAGTQITNHQAATDPHGDRAYALGLVNPITASVNLPNGYVVLNSQGKIPQNLVAGTGGSGGSFTNVYDVVASYGATGNGVTDDSGAIQNALNACAAAGGGEVWIPSGTYALANTLIIGANTWFHQAPGAVMKRITGASTPLRMLSNIAFPSGSTTPAAGNIKISGGTWNAYGSGLSGTCTPIFIMQAAFVEISETQIVSVPNNPAIELNGSSDVIISSCLLTGPGNLGATVPAVRLNTSNTATTPSGLTGGLYNNANCANVTIRDTGVVASGNVTYGSFIGTDLTVSAEIHTNITVNNCFAPAMPVGPIVANNWSGYIASHNQFKDWLSNGVYSDDLSHLFSGVGATGLPSSTNMRLYGDLYYASGGSYKNEPNQETWHPLTTQSPWTQVGGNNPPLQYRRISSPPNSVEIIGVLNFNTSSNTVATIPFSLAHTQKFPHNAAGTVNVDTSGNITIDTYILQAMRAAGINITPQIVFHGIISLDA